MVDIAHVCARIHAKQGQTRANFWRRHDTKSFDQISVNNELFNNCELTWSDRRIMWSVWDFLNVRFWQLANNLELVLHWCSGGSLARVHCSDSVDFDFIGEFLSFKLIDFGAGFNEMRWKAPELRGGSSPVVRQRMDNEYGERLNGFLPAGVVQVPKQELQRYLKCKRIGNYLLGKTIGEGSFARVKQGFHVLTGEKVGGHLEITASF